MTREEVKVVFTGLAHDHLMSSSALRHGRAYQQQAKRNSSHLDDSPYRANQLHHLHHPHHQHNHHNHQYQQHHAENHLHHLHRNRARNHSQHEPRHYHQHHQHNNNQHHHLQQQYRNGDCHAHHIQPLGGCTNENLPGARERTQSAHVPAPSVLAANQVEPKQEAAATGVTAMSTIAILRRHPMYDSLVLVKKYRPCLGGYTLEFPTENENDRESENTKAELAIGEKSNGRPAVCGRTKLVSVYLDGDDPIYQSQQVNLRQQSEAIGQSAELADGEMVYVPVNGLMDRLENYDRQGIAIDSRVYAFAMGLKTAERFLTSSTVKEMQEAPPL